MQARGGLFLVFVGVAVFLALCTDGNGGTDGNGAVRR